MVFDSNALLKFFQNEPGGSAVGRFLRETQRKKWIKYLCAINLGEIVYATKRQFGDQSKIEVLAHIYRLNFTILPVPNELIFQAAEFKAEYPIAFADCFALACAVQHNAPIVTGDPEFKKVEHLTKIHWV